MEKFGVANEDLVRGLKDRYVELKNRQMELVKTGAVADILNPGIRELEAIQSRIDELEAKGDESGR